MTREARRFWILLAVTVLLAVANLWQFYRQVMQHVHVESARDQLQTFNEFATRARTAQLHTFRNYERAIRDYYPSGSKQVTGSATDLLVESARQHALDEVKFLEDTWGKRRSMVEQPSFSE